MPMAGDQGHPTVGETVGTCILLLHDENQILNFGPS